MGEFLTRSSIWLTIACYFVGSVLLALSFKKPALDRSARLVWTVGCVALGIHFIFAYQFYHQWSQTAAYEETARQTKDVVGVYWGGGVYINFALLAFWLIDAGWWWLHGSAAYRTRSRTLIALWHGFLLFIFFNATVIFKAGALRWIGLVLCSSLVLTWISANRNRSVVKA